MTTSPQSQCIGLALHNYSDSSFYSLSTNFVQFISIPTELKEGPVLEAARQYNVTARDALQILDNRRPRINQFVIKNNLSSISVPRLLFSISHFDFQFTNRFAYQGIWMVHWLSICSFPIFIELYRWFVLFSEY